MALDPNSLAVPIQSLLDEFPHAVAQAGRDCAARGGVLQLKPVNGGRSYSAVVKDRRAYLVTIDFDEAVGWDALCSCPAVFDCKHIYAALLLLRDRETLLPGLSGVFPTPSDRRAAPAPPIPPPSPLVARYIEATGKAPKGPAKSFVGQIQRLFQSLGVRSSPSLYSHELNSLAPGIRNYTWQPLELWPKTPLNDLEFWLYCAWEIRRQGVPIPDFMEAVTDFTLIEPAMQKLERAKSISHWQTQLAEAHQTGILRPAPPVDLRVLVRATESAIIQWRSTPEEPFKELKQAQARRLMQAHQGDTLSLVPEATPLWHLILNPYDSRPHSDLRYASSDAARILNRILRLPSLIDRVVSESGLPLKRPTEPLHFDLLPATSDDEDYRLRLVHHDGSPAPHTLLALPGNPPLYLTPSAVFVGPPPHRFGSAPELTIPAPAVETPGGVGFLASLGVELPPRLASRTRRIEVGVKIFCDLRPSYPGSDKESLFVRVLAEQADAKVERFAGNGWEVVPQPGAKKSKPSSDGLIPVVDRSALDHFPAVLEGLELKWEQFAGGWRGKLTKEFPELFISWIAALPSGIEVMLDPELASLKSAPLAGSVRLDVQESGVDWFDLTVVLDVADTELTPDELKLLLNARGRYVRLGKKGWRRLQFNLSPEEDDRLARLGLDARDFTAEPTRLHALQLADEGATRLLPLQQVETIQRRASELKARVAPKVPRGIQAELRPYQLEGFHFLAYLTANRFGGVLADDMGLGKTLQTLTWLAWLRSNPKELRSKLSGLPSLVVCPKSVMDNWQTEGQRFLPGLRVRLWRGEDVVAFKAAREECDLIVINYSQLRALSPDIASLQWHAAILDEAQYIKNPDSQTAQVARALQAHHRLALTGTPIENRLLDLWSIMAYAMPGVLGNRAQFTRKFNATDDPLARRRLASRVRPFLLRRTKNQVAKDLPDRVEEDLLCELEGDQKNLYRAELKRAQQLLLKVQTRQELNENRFSVLTSLLRLRQICCHPALVDGAMRKAESAKVNALTDLLEPLMEEGHKVLVFSQFVTMLDLLRDTFKERGWNHFYLAGDTEDRGSLVKEFQKQSGSSVFLISLKAGGFGLNLTAASYVVLFDPWWNPAVENQAIDRTHRIGQTTKVMAYRLLMKNTIEEKIRTLQKTKAALADGVLGEETFASSLTLDDLRFLFAES
ncbi:MAG: DEAD/DEAH box helicase [Verrucomicrobiales bacterium]|nr:DEAD/DEAH box helicase [Verrucomicrobiales bacterium]